MRTLGANADIWRTDRAWDIEGCLEMIARRGYAGVLLYAAEGRAFVERNAEGICRALAETRLALLQLHAAWPGLVDADARAREAALAEHRAWAELAVALDARTLVVHPTGIAASGRYLAGRDALARLAEAYAGLAETLASSSTRLAIENDVPHPDRPDRPVTGGRVEELLSLCDMIGRDDVGLCLDVSHCWANGENPVDAAQYARDRILTTHLHDTRGDFDEHLPPGKGKTDWPALIAALPERAPLVLEIDPQADRDEAERLLAESERVLRVLNSA